MNIRYVIIIIGLMILFSGCTSIEDRPETDSHLEEEDHHEGEEIDDFEVNPGEVAKMIESGEEIVVVDLRSVNDYSEGHAAGAISIPFEKLSMEKLSSMGIEVHYEIYVYDLSGRKGENAAKIMKSFGFENVHSITGGYTHWEEDKYPIEKGEPVEEVAAKNKNGDGPRIFAEETSFEFGVISQFGGVVTHDFEIQNKGNEDLEIISLATSCGCTSAEIDREIIPPGETAIVKAIFDADFHEEPEGRFKRTIFIESNDPEVEEFMLNIFVEINPGKK